MILPTPTHPLSCAILTLAQRSTDMLDLALPQKRAFLCLIPSEPPEITINSKIQAPWNKRLIRDLCVFLLRVTDLNTVRYSV